MSQCSSGVCADPWLKFSLGSREATSSQMQACAVSAVTQALTLGMWARRQLLVAFEDPGQMAALHSVGTPPELLAQVMPVQLPQLTSQPDGDIRHSLAVLFGALRALLKVVLGHL